MSVIGIDFGSENCYVAAVRSGGIEILSTDTGQRMIPSYIGFGEKKRTYGIAAKSAHVTNIKNTVFGFKRLLGGKFTEEFVLNETTYFPYSICEMKNGFLGVKVHYRRKDTKFYILQLVSMLLAKLKVVAEKALDTTVSNCVIAVPSYFNDIGRRSMLYAAHIAGLNVVKLINETSAVALSYGFYKQNLSEDKPVIVAFIDFGCSAFQVSVCAITKSNVKVLSSVSDTEVGGRDFDNYIVRYFAEEFKKKYNLDVLSNERAIIRLLAECEKLKKQLSANPQPMPLNIECFMEDKDVSGILSREMLEKMSSDLLARVESAMRRALAESKQHFSDITAVELVGGSSRIPAIKPLVQKVFRCEPSTTLNLDEAVARGCALQCAMFSPNLKVRDFYLTDVQPYPIRLVWSISKGEQGEVEVFPKNHQIPFSKYLTYFRTDKFTLSAHYGELQEAPSESNKIGSFTICGVTRSPSGESAKVQLKVRINVHGIFTISSAAVVDKDNAEVIDQRAEDSLDINKSLGGTMSIFNEEEKPDKKDSKKPTSKSTGLPIMANIPSFTSNELSKFVEEELSMEEADKAEEARVDAKNALEEFIYEIRGSLDNDLKHYIDRKECDNFLHRLQMVENWLYDEGENQPKDIFNRELCELKGVIDPVISRKREFDQLTSAIASLKNELQNAEQILKLYSIRDQEYVNLDPRKVEELHKVVEDKRKFLEVKLSQLSHASCHRNPPVQARQLLQEREFLVSCISSTLNNKPNQTTEQCSGEHVDGRK